jgi:membrane protein
MKPLKHIRTLFANIKDDGCFNNAASIAYFTVLSSLPLIFLITTTIGFFTGSNVVVVKNIYNIISPYVPNLSYEFWQKLTGWFSRSSYGLNIFSVVILILSSTLVFNSIDKSLRKVFAEFELKKRSSLESLLRYFSLILFLILVVFLFMSFDIFFVFMKRLSRKQEIVFFKTIMLRLNYLFPFISLILQTATIFLVFRLFIGKKMRLKEGIICSAFIVIMWMLAIKAFSWYVNTIPAYNLIYGSMSIFIVFMTWSYYSALIFLLGAEILKLMLKNEN